MNRKILMAMAMITIANGAEEMPIMAKSGQCFTKSFYPPKYTKVTKVKSSKRVLLSDESIKYDVIPAEYSFYEEKVKVSDGTENVVIKAAVYKTVQERILLESAKQVWRKSLNKNDTKAFNSCVESAEKMGMNIDTAKVGTCYYEHFEAEKYRTTTSKILASEASERIIVIPATYRTITKKILTDSTSVKLLPSVAKYKKVKDKVVVAPARTEWKKTICNDRGCNQSEVVCLVEVPTTYREVTKRIVLEPAVAKSEAVKPVYKTIKVQEMVQPVRTKSVAIPSNYKTVEQRKKVENSKYYWSDASNKNASTRIRNECNKICLTEIPAKYRTVSKKIVLSPESSKLIKTPATYTMVKIKKMTQKASYKKTVIPQEYITVITQRERTKGYSKWMPMICEEMLTVKIIKKVQQALKSQGVYAGAVDGVWNIESKSAARAYQKKNGLGITSKLSIETMKSLDVY